MEIGLRLRLLAQRSTLLLKAASFASLLVFVRFGGRGFVISALSVVVFAVLYLAPLWRTASYAASFSILVILSLIATASIENVAIFWLFFAAAAFLSYGIFGLKTFQFVYRREWHQIVILSLFYLTALLGSSVSRPDFADTMRVSVGIFFVSVVLLWEFFAHVGVGRLGAISIEKIMSRMLAVVTVGLILTEVFWIISLLPVAGANVAGVFVAAAYFLTELLRENAEPPVNRKTVLVNLTVFIALVLISLITAQWS